MRMISFLYDNPSLLMAVCLTMWPLTVPALLASLLIGALSRPARGIIYLLPVVAGLYFLGGPAAQVARGYVTDPTGFGYMVMGYETFFSAVVAAVVVVPWIFGLLCRFILAKPVSG